MTTVPIPHLLTDITADWLTAALRSRGTHTTVAAVEITAIGTGQTGSTYRLTPVYDGDATGLPSTFVLKLPAEDESIRSGVAFGYRSEVSFYDGPAATTRIPVPRCYFSAIS